MHNTSTRPRIGQCKVMLASDWSVFILTLGYRTAHSTVGGGYINSFITKISLIASFRPTSLRGLEAVVGEENCSVLGFIMADQGQKN